jgi:hypothetical protein
LRARLTVLFWLVSIAFPLKADSNPDIVISQVGINFVEIFNRSGHSVSVAGWSVQYTYGPYDATGDWEAIPIQGEVASRQYYLIEVDGSNVLQPDASGSFPFPHDGAPGLNFEGTIALSRIATPLTVAWPSILGVADLFGYGQGSAADGAPFAGLGVQAAVRLQGGCVETHNNATDFVLSAPAPRNTHSPKAACAGSPIIQANGIVNAASLVAGPVAPGEIVTVFGANLGPPQGGGNRLANPAARPRVLFDGNAASTISASDGQVNVLAPPALAGRGQTTVQVENNGVLSDAQTLPVAQTAPGIYTAQGTGTGQATALNQDSTVNSVDLPERPARGCLRVRRTARSRPGFPSRRCCQ